MFLVHGSRVNCLLATSSSLKPLDGIRILDLSHTLAGPFATMLLSDLGARVIKVESPAGDETRSWAPHVNGFSAYFASINRGKESVVINLKREEGRNVLYRLVKDTHVIIENFRPGVREKLGVDPETIFSVNPDIIYCSIKGFGTGSTPYRDLPAYDIIIQAMSGLMASTGEEGRPPVRVSFALFDVMTAYMAALNILAALLAKREDRLESGAYIEVPMYDVAIYSMVYVPNIYLMTRREPRRMGSGHPSIVPYQAFKAGDGKYFILAAANDRLWARACEALGMPELAEDPRFRTNLDRVRNRDALVKILEQVFAARPRDHWVKLFRSKGVPAAPVYSVGEVFSDPHVTERKLVMQMPHPSLGSIPQLTYPVTINGVRPVSSRYPPLKGEHTDKVLMELGFSEKELEELRKLGAIE